MRTNVNGTSITIPGMAEIELKQVCRGIRSNPMETQWLQDHPETKQELDNSPLNAIVITED